MSIFPIKFDAPFKSSRNLSFHKIPCDHDPHYLSDFNSQLRISLYSTASSLGLDAPVSKKIFPLLQNHTESCAAHSAPQSMGSGVRSWGSKVTGYNVDHHLH
jgi:hypothetical protein